MKTHFLYSLTVLSIILPAQLVSADEVPPKNYLLFPISTELQRYLLGSTSNATYAAINANEILVEGKFRPEALGVESFRSDLQALVTEGKEPQSSLSLYLRFAGQFPKPDEQRKLESEVKAICQTAGFVRVRIGMTFESEKWTDKVARINASSADPSLSETPIDSELVRVFPVCTKLSHFLLGDVDCFVQLRQPIDGRFLQFPKSIHESIVKSVASLALSSKRVIMFRCLTTTSGRNAVEKYFSPQGNELSLSDKFAREMGFHTALWSMVQMPVEPEGLLGKKAPDFILESLTGEELNLHKAIQGRVAVIAFWGVACGGCRIEAPYLTALHNRYHQHGLSVIAVNGYNESKEVIAKYVQEKSLTHPIALMGQNIAKDKYTVMSYPVTFLVDHNGVIKDYHLGFDSGDEKHLFAKVAQMLHERDQAIGRQ